MIFSSVTLPKRATSLLPPALNASQSNYTVHCSGSSITRSFSFSLSLSFSSSFKNDLDNGIYRQRVFFNIALIQQLIGYTRFQKRSFVSDVDNGCCTVIPLEKFSKLANGDFIFRWPWIVTPIQRRRSCTVYRCRSDKCVLKSVLNDSE